MKTIDTADGLASAGRLKSPRGVAYTSGLSPAVAAVFALLSSAVAGIVTAVLGGGIASILILSALFGLMVLFDYRIGVGLMIVILPFSQSDFFPRELFGITGANPYNLLAMATFGAMLVRPVRNHAARFIFDKRSLWMVVPVVLAGLNGLDDLDKIPLILFLNGSASFNGAVGYLVTAVIKPLMLILLSVVVATGVADLRRPESILWLITASALGLAFLVIAYFLFSGLPLTAIASASDRAFLSGTGYHANAIGMILIIVFAMLLHAGTASTDGPTRIFLFASLIPIGIAILLSFSRTAFVLFAIIWVWYLISQRRPGVIILGMIMLVIIIIALPNPVYDRLATGLDQGLTTEKGDPLTAGRVGGLWLPVMDDMTKHPERIIVGEGMEAMLWSDAVRSGRALPTGHPHNAYLKTLQDMGAVGLACMVVFFSFILAKINQLRRNTRLDASLRGFFDGTRVALFAYLIGGLAGYSLTPAIQQMYLWIAFGVALGCSAAQRAQMRSGSSREKLQR